MKEEMTVGDLILALGEFPSEMKIRFAYDYGDYVHTLVADKIYNVEIGKVKYSDYHLRDRVIDEDDDEEGEEVVIMNLS